MESTISSGEFYVSHWMESFIDTTIRFAIWRAEPSVEHVAVGLSRRPDGRVSCRLDAWRSDGSTLSATGIDREAFAAIQGAADRLEVALFAPTEQSSEACVAA